MTGVRAKACTGCGSDGPFRVILRSTTDRVQVAARCSACESSERVDRARRQRAREAS